MIRPSDISIRLDSASTGAKWNFSPSGGAQRVLWCDAETRKAYLHHAGQPDRQWDNPLEALAWMSGSLEPKGDEDRRWAGFLSYDLGALFEPSVETKAKGGDLPLFVFTEHSNAKPHGDFGSPRRPIARREVPLHSNFTRAAYEAAVGRTIEYIRAGDVFQVNLSQRFTVAAVEPLRQIYDRLDQFSRAEYGAYLDYGDFALLSNSPELFLRVTPDRRVITRPIKGTRSRGEGMERELRGSIKDQAELNMVVDLERNDLGRVCRIGSVKVTEPRTIEAHPTVYHGVATVEGVLRDDVGLVDLLRATFPGGSVTGAPKIRAMQIIDELEPVSRGPYCGAIGYLAADGSIEFNVAIRTMTLRDGLAHIPVGGGIVADSNPAAEYEETIVKARAMFAALGIGAEEIGAATR